MFLDSSLYRSWDRAQCKMKPNKKRQSIYLRFRRPFPIFLTTNNRRIPERERERPQTTPSNGPALLERHQTQCVDVQATIIMKM